MLVLKRKMRIRVNRKRKVRLIEALSVLIIFCCVHLATRPGCQIVDGFNKAPSQLVYRQEGKHPDLFPRYDADHLANGVLWKVAEREYGGVAYNRHLPLIFVGGHPRSGTTLMRSMLDAHPDVHCGEETHIIPQILDKRYNFVASYRQAKLNHMQVGESVQSAAVSDFILEIIVKHGKPASHYCNKDPFTMAHGAFLHETFPNARMIFMIRDGRATAHSIVQREVGIGRMDITSYRDVLTKWNDNVNGMWNQCRVLGEYCLMVKYEDLVLHPRSTLHTIVNFAGVEWHDWLMEHEKHMDMIGLSGVEKSTDQVKKPLYTDSLMAWVGQIPVDVEQDIRAIAPMIATLGYDITSHNPTYGQPDAEVTERYHDWLSKQEERPQNSPTVHVADRDEHNPQMPGRKKVMQGRRRAQPQIKLLP